MLRTVALLLISLCLGSVRAADKPTLEQIYPSGAAPDSTNEITLLGKFEPWPPKAWANVPGLEWRFTTNKGKAQLVVSNDAPVGPCLVRIYNDEGPSDLRIFVITETSEMLEVEPNNHFRKAQALANLPTTINGRLEKNGDVDSFIFPMRAGEWLDASVDAYTILAKLDPVLRLVTTNGYQLAWNHDFSSLDPRLIWQAPYDGDVVLQLFGFAYPADSDIRLTGGAAGVYRLHLRVSNQAPADMMEPATEHEPNNSTNNAASIPIPAEVSGVISPKGDVDRFSLSLQKDVQIEAQVQAAAIGSPLDAWLSIEDGTGKELARNDDANNSRDPRLEWKAPADGTYFLALGSLTHQGGADCRYHLTARALGPDFRVTPSADAFTVAPGATNSIKLNLKRLRGFTNELSAAAAGLPEGIIADSITLPAKDGEFPFSIIASTNATPWNGPFRIVVSDKGSGTKRGVPFELVSRSENNGVPGGYSKLLIESLDQLWLTIKSAEPTTAKK